MTDNQDQTPQLEDGFTRIANELLEAIINKMPCRIPGPVAIFLAVMRETYGFGRKSAEITTERFKKITGIEHRNNIYRAIKEAIELNLIKAIKNDGRNTVTYSVQKNYLKWNKQSKMMAAIKNDGDSNQKRLLQQSKMMAVCMLKKPSKETSKEKELGQLSPAQQKQPEEKQKRRRQLPPDFELTDDLNKFAIQQGINGGISLVFANFCDHHRAKGSAMLDWDAAWRTWVRNEVKFSRSKPGTQTQPTGSYTPPNRLQQLLKENQEREKYLRGEIPKPM